MRPQPGCRPPALTFGRTSEPQREVGKHYRGADKQLHFVYTLKFSDGALQIRLTEDRLTEQRHARSRCC